MAKAWLHLIFHSTRAGSIAALVAIGLCSWEGSESGQEMKRCHICLSVVLLILRLRSGVLLAGDVLVGRQRVH